jgi:hypothetical protein
MCSFQDIELQQIESTMSSVVAMALDPVTVHAQSVANGQHLRLAIDVRPRAELSG